MIHLDKVNVSFRKENTNKIFKREWQQVLYDISVEIQKGECVGILGESGSGKSTLGRILCGLLKPDSGNLEIHGKIAVVFQDYTTSANPRFTVKQIILESLFVREGKKRWWSSVKKDYESFDKEIEEMLKLVGLSGEYIDRFPHELSGGQLQRVCIARVLALRPDIILFDEAISSLDALTQVQIMDLLIQIKNQFSLTYVFITHDLTSITYFCDRVLFILNGKIVEDQKVSSLVEIKSVYAEKLLTSVLDIRGVTR